MTNVTKNKVITNIVGIINELEKLENRTSEPQNKELISNIKNQFCRSFNDWFSDTEKTQKLINNIECLAIYIHKWAPSIFALRKTLLLRYCNNGFKFLCAKN